MIKEIELIKLGVVFIVCLLLFIFNPWYPFKLFACFAMGLSAGLFVAQLNSDDDDKYTL